MAFYGARSGIRELTDPWPFLVQGVKKNGVMAYLVFGMSQENVTPGLGIIQLPSPQPYPT